MKSKLKIKIDGQIYHGNESLFHILYEIGHFYTCMDQLSTEMRESSSLALPLAPGISKHMKSFFFQEVISSKNNGAHKYSALDLK